MAEAILSGSARYEEAYILFFDPCSSPFHILLLFLIFFRWLMQQLYCSSRRGLAKGNQGGTVQFGLVTRRCSSLSGAACTVTVTVTSLISVLSQQA